MSDAAISADSEITLYFALKMENGDIVDSNFEAEPASCRIGDGSLLPGLERYLLGLRPGHQREFTVPAEEGFGQRNPDNVQTIPRARFSGIALEPGLVVSFADAADTELPGVVSALEGDRVTVDFNHPLAGSTLLFQVHIVDVK